MPATLTKASATAKNSFFIILKHLKFYIIYLLDAKNDEKTTLLSNFFRIPPYMQY